MITNTFSTLEIGSSFTIFLFRIVTLQTYLYYSHFHEDPLVVKALVHSAHVLILSLGMKLSKLIHRSAWFGLVPGVGPHQLELPVRFTEQWLPCMRSQISYTPCLALVSQLYLEDGLRCLSRYKIYNSHFPHHSPHPPFLVLAHHRTSSTIKCGVFSLIHDILGYSLVF